MRPSLTPNGGLRHSSNSSETGTVRLACLFRYSNAASQIGARRRGSSPLCHRGDETPALPLLHVQSGRFEYGREQAALGRKSFDAEAQLALVEDHAPQQVVLCGDGVT